MGGDVVGLVALDLVLRLILGGAMPMAFVVEIGIVDLDDPAADHPGFRIPPDVIADTELGHDVLALGQKIHCR